jgi:hypothetical protein
MARTLNQVVWYVKCNIAKEKGSASTLKIEEQDGQTYETPLRLLCEPSSLIGLANAITAQYLDICRAWPYHACLTLIFGRAHVIFSTKSTTVCSGHRATSATSSSA